MSGGYVVLIGAVIGAAAGTTVNGANVSARVGEFVKGGTVGERDGLAMGSALGRNVGPDEGREDGRDDGALVTGGAVVVVAAAAVMGLAIGSGVGNRTRRAPEGAGEEARRIAEVEGVSSSASALGNRTTPEGRGAGADCVALVSDCSVAAADDDREDGLLLLEPLLFVNSSTPQTTATAVQTKAATLNKTSSFLLCVALLFPRLL